MNNEAVLNRLQQVFDSVFPSKVNLRADLSAHMVDEWDSLLHVKLILAVEKEFQIRFTLPEISSFQNAGDLIHAVSAKVQAKSKS
jgi:acyl carrier protein